MNLEKLTLLYVEDEFSVRKSLELYLKNKVKEIYTAADGIEGLNLYRKMKPDIVLTDIEMPELDGIEMARTIKNENKNALIIFLSSHSDEETFKKSFRTGAESFFSKYDDYEDLIEEIKRLAMISHTRKEEEFLFKTIEEVIDTQDNMLAVVESGEIKIANKSFLQFHQIKTPQEFHEKYNKLGDIVLSEISEDNNTIKNFFYKDIESKVKLVDDELNEKYFSLHLSKLSSINQKMRYLVNLNDVTDYEEKTEELYKLATTDSLTKLTNRLKAEEFIQREMFFSKKYEHPMSLIFFDIDDFKVINDSYGHQAGDKVLIKTVSTVRSLLNESDLFVRWGGEEFIVVTIGLDIIDTFLLADNLRKKIAEADVGVPQKITCSFGVTQLHYDDGMNDFIARADMALYEAKHQGKNKVVRLVVE